MDQLPQKNSPELQRVFDEVAAMLRTLVLKPPISVSRIAPESGPPGTKVTVYGAGFKLPGRIGVVLKDFPNNPMPQPWVSPDGNTLTFQLPTSVDIISCRQGYIDIAENCVPVPPNHVDVNDCPPTETRWRNVCGIPLPPGTYHFVVSWKASGVRSNEFSFTVTPPEPAPVSVSLIYPNRLVSPGDFIVVRGAGFTPSGNTVTISSAVVRDLPSADGKTITFSAPMPAGKSVIPRIRVFEASVSNPRGTSNAISFGYR